jgi:hypothetical protein
MNQDKQKLPPLDPNNSRHYAEAGAEWNTRVSKDAIWNPFEVRLIEERMQRERQLLAALAENAELKAQLAGLGGICPHCRGRADLPPNHIERCYCLPEIKRRMAEIDTLRKKLEEFRDALNDHIDRGDIHCDECIALCSWIGANK